MNHILKAVLLLFACSAIGQNTSRKYESYAWKADVLEVKTSDGYYRIRFYSDQIIETSFIPAGQSFEPESHAVVAQNTMRPDFVDASDFLELSSSAIKMKVQKAPFEIFYFYKDRFLISEKNGYTKKDSIETLDFNLAAEEALYGGGARALGMNRRGNRLQLYNKAHYGYGDRSELLNFTMPIALSSKMYLLHFDNAPIGFLDLDSKKDNTLTYETLSGRKTYQIVAGPSWEEVLENYTTLTGKQPLPPRWAFGNFSSRFGYHSQKEAEETIRRFRAEKIPVDAIIFDLYWFGKQVKGTMGNLAVDRDSFPDFEQMVNRFNKDGIKTVLITEPFVLTTSKRWDEAVSHQILATDLAGKPYTYDFYFGNTGLIDLFKPQARDWFWNIYKDLAEKGVSGVWGDLGEPEVHPSKLRHATGSADELHNIYGHNWAKLIADGYHKDFPAQRPFILMRAGYSGSQRFGMIPWSGDVGRSWGGLKSQTEIALQMGMQGMAYMHSDLGGFAGDNVDNELYVRWLQYGIFQPVFRPHAQESVPPEAVYKEEKTKALAKCAIEMRYELLGYNYTLGFENNQKGIPMMRPLLFEEPGNATVYGRSDEYLWGKAFLVAPVTEPGQKEKEVYFPDTANWFDFYTDEKHRHGSTATITLHPDYIPVFARGGAFVPLVDLVQTTRDYSTKNIDLHFFFDQEQPASDGQLYNDDGATPQAFEKGRYEILHFTSKSDQQQLAIDISNEKGSQMFELDRNIRLTVHNLQTAPKKVLVDGKKIRAKWDKSKKLLTLNLKYQRKKSKSVILQLTK